MTVKHGYLPDEIKKEDIHALSEPLKGRLFYFPKGTEHAKCIEEGAIENFRIQVNRDNAQQETVRWVQLSNKDAERYRDGLTVEGMEIRGFKGWFVRNFVKPQDFLKPSFRKQSVDLTAELARQGGCWLIITSEGQTVADLIETGYPSALSFSERGSKTIRIIRSQPADRMLFPARIPKPEVIEYI
jgi:hypothetical protein